MVSKDRFTDYTGKKFHRLTAQWPAGRNKGRMKWLFLCECGNISILTPTEVVTGHTKSCGCWNKESRSIRATIHGMSRQGAHNLIYDIYHRAKNRAKKLRTSF
jgi:hypothetical protein